MQIGKILYEKLGALQLMLVLQELHKRGYQKLRWYSYMAPTGLSLRCFITTEDNIIQNREIKSYEGPVWYTSGSADSGISDIQPFMQECLEELRETGLLDLGKGEDAPYSILFNDLVEQAKKGNFPYFDREYWSAPNGMICVGKKYYPKPPMSREYLQSKINIVFGDITKLNVDAIVNAANKSLLGGGGIDGAIHKAAGPKLLEECKKLGGCPTGQCKMTDAYNMPCRKIIHAVGPKWDDHHEDTSTPLMSCYDNALTLAERNYLKSIAFPCISTGIYKFPKEEAARIAIATVIRHLERGTYDGEVFFCCFSKEDEEIYKHWLKEYFS